MTTRIGPKQRPIIEALKRGAELRQSNGAWTLDGEPVNHERCLRLFMLTEKGKGIV